MSLEDDFIAVIDCWKNTVPTLAPPDRKYVRYWLSLAPLPEVLNTITKKLLHKFVTGHLDAARPAEHGQRFTASCLKRYAETNLPVIPSGAAGSP